MSGRPPGMVMPGGESRICKCGYKHPPPWDDQCPMMEEQSRDMDEKSQSIANFCKGLASFLHDRDDYKTIIDAFNKRLKI